MIKRRSSEYLVCYQVTRVRMTGHGRVRVRMVTVSVSGWSVLHRLTHENTNER
jgi:hypothetical protein